MRTDALTAMRISSKQAISPAPSGHGRWDQVGWKSYVWKPEHKFADRGANVAGISTFARRLMAIERARIRRGTPAVFRSRLPWRRLGAGR